MSMSPRKLGSKYGDEELETQRSKVKVAKVSDLIKEKELTKIERCFGRQFNDLVYFIRFPVVIVVIVYISVCIYFATIISPLTGEEEYVPNSHPVMVGLNKSLESFIQGESDRKLKLTFFWGVEGVDQSENIAFDPLSLGEIIWDEEFNLDVEEN